MTPDFHTAYDCNDRRTTVLYYDLALAQALHQATELGLGDHRATVSEIYPGVVAQQRPNGGFSYHSRRNYGILSGKRGYPRYLSMMLVHLLIAHGQGILARVRLGLGPGDRLLEGAKRLSEAAEQVLTATGPLVTAPLPACVRREASKGSPTRRPIQDLHRPGGFRDGRLLDAYGSA